MPCRHIRVGHISMEWFSSGSEPILGWISEGLRNKPCLRLEQTGSYQHSRGTGLSYVDLILLKPPPPEIMFFNDTSQQAVTEVQWLKEYLRMNGAVWSCLTCRVTAMCDMRSWALRGHEWLCHIEFKSERLLYIADLFTVHMLLIHRTLYSTCTSVVTSAHTWCLQLGKLIL